MKKLLLNAVLVSAFLSPAADAFAQVPLRDPATIARAELLRKGHAAADVEGLVVTDAYTDRRTGILHAYMRQAVNGIEVYGTEVALHVKPDGTIVSLHERLVKGASAHAAKGGVTLTPEQALERVMVMEGLRPVTLVRKRVDGRRRQVVFAGEGLTSEDPEVRLFMLEHQGQLVAVWNVTLYMPDGSHWWNVRLDASTGKELERNDWVSQCRFDEPALAHARHGHGEASPAPAPAAAREPQPWRTRDPQCTLDQRPERLPVRVERHRWITRCGIHHHTGQQRIRFGGPGQ
jgi:Zn-dependent metalloprotease